MAIKVDLFDLKSAYTLESKKQGSSWPERIYLDGNLHSSRDPKRFFYISTTFESFHIIFSVGANISHMAFSPKCNVELWEKSMRIVYLSPLHTT